NSRQAEAEQFFRRIGITFNVYGDQAGTERLIPFDIIPRVLTAKEWQHLERGLEQRVKALNAFIKDVYGNREIVAAGVVPEELVLQNP
ncbi:circularly permuted type 2 ATP-grasp protein, partial [Staphylococcus aureus]